MSAEIIHYSLDKFWWAKFSSHERYLDPWFPVSLHVAKNNEHKNLWVYVSTGAFFCLFFFFKFCHRLCCDWGKRQVLLQTWIHRNTLWKVGAALPRAPLLSSSPHLTGGVGSAGRLLQAPWVWVGLRAGVGPLVSLRLGKGLLGKTQACHFINH